MSSMKEGKRFLFRDPNVVLPGRNSLRKRGRPGLQERKRMRRALKHLHAFISPGPRASAYTRHAAKITHRTGYTQVTLTLQPPRRTHSLETHARTTSDGPMPERNLHERTRHRDQKRREIPKDRRTPTQHRPAPAHRPRNRYSPAPPGDGSDRVTHTRTSS